MNHQSRFFNLLSLALLFALVACQAPATPLPTETLLPTNTTIPPTSTVAPTQIPTTIPDTTTTNIIFSDSFDDNQHNWQAAQFIDEGESSFILNNGELIETLSKTPSRGFSYLDGNYADVHIVVDTILKEGENNTMMGVACRYQFDNSLNAYFFAIYADGYFRIFKVVDDQLTVLVEDKKSNSILIGKKTNTIEAICVDNRLQLFVNNQLIATTIDDSLKNGSIGLFSFNVRESNIVPVVAFDNLVVSEPQTCLSDKNVFSPLSATEYIGEIDGAKLTTEAEILKGAEVGITGTVIESEYFFIPEQVDATLVLADIPDNNGNTYKALILLPDGGLAFHQYISGTEIHAVGIHLGNIPTPPGLFKVSPTVDNVSFPAIAVELASGGCKQ